MDRYAAAVQLCEAIERHRDTYWMGRPVTDPYDSELYAAAVWFRSQQQEEQAYAERERLDHPQDVA